MKDVKHIALNDKRLINEIPKILKGIDKTEAEDADGWWETSTGAEFGASKLKQLKTLITKNKSRIISEKGKVFKIKNGKRVCVGRFPNKKGIPISPNDDYEVEFEV